MKLVLFILVTYCALLCGCGKSDEEKATELAAATKAALEQSIAPSREDLLDRKEKLVKYVAACDRFEAVKAKITVTVDNVDFGSFSPKVPVTVHNGSPEAIGGVRLHFIYKASDREVPYLEDYGSATPSGGINPDETRTDSAYLSSVSSHVFKEYPDGKLSFILVNIFDKNGKSMLPQWEGLGKMTKEIAQKRLMEVQADLKKSQ